MADLHPHVTGVLLCTLSYFLYITNACFSSFCFVSFPSLLPHPCLTYSVSHLLSLSPHPPSLVVSGDREVVLRPPKKVTGLKWNECGKKTRKKKQEKSAGGSTRGLCCQLDTTQMERGRVRDIDRQRRSGRERKKERERERR